MAQQPFHHDLRGLLRLQLDDAALDQLAWKDFGNGVRIAKLARDGETGLVVYDIAADAKNDAFQPHKHVAGEAYLVLRGAIDDATGRYGEGEIVWMSAGSVHNPRGVGRTVVLVLLLRCTPCGSESGRSLHGDWQELTGAIAS